jgi:hypothetical protein
MKLTDVSSESLEKLTNVILTNLHFKIHQIWAHRKRKNINIPLLKTCHDMIKREMEKRNLNHNPLSLRKNLNKLYIYNEDID